MFVPFCFAAGKIYRTRDCEENRLRDLKTRTKHDSLKREPPPPGSCLISHAPGVGVGGGGGGGRGREWEG